MCLAIPGKILEILENDPVLRTGKVSFGGVVKDVSLFFTPEAKPGDYVIVHAGIALHTLDEAEAMDTLRLLDSLEEPEK